MTAEYIATFTNEETAMTSFITVGRNGFYHVSWRDDDSGEFVPTVLIYETQEAAITKAREIFGYQ